MKAFLLLLRFALCFSGGQLFAGTAEDGTAGPAAASLPPARIACNRNGDMTAGADVPEHWQLSGWQQGTLALSRDTAVFVSAPAALRLATDGRAAGFAHTRLDPAPPGRTLSITGHLKVHGTFASVQVALQCFDATWRQTEWKTLHVASGPGGDWHRFAGRHTVAADTAHVLLGVSVDGTGTVLLDDVAAVCDAPQPAPQPPPVAAAALPVAVPHDAPELRYVGRFVPGETGTRCAWPASRVILRFDGTDANVLLTASGSDRYQVVLDGRPVGMLKPPAGRSRQRAASKLAPGIHVVEIIKCTEASFGTGTIHGFEINGGAVLLPAPVAARRIHAIGDSVTTGYGNEAPDQNQRFSPDTQNGSQTYGAIAARAFGADYTCVAWSGRRMWPDHTIGEVYDYALPVEKVTYTFPTSDRPDVVTIALSGNDFRGGVPPQDAWTAAYLAFIERVRARYPEAWIYVANSPMMDDKWDGEKRRARVLVYLRHIVATRRAAGDTRIALCEWMPQRMSDGLGADWHPSVRTQEINASALVAAIERDLDWKPHVRPTGGPRLDESLAPHRVQADHQGLRYVGRWHQVDASRADAAWSGSAVRFRFRGARVGAWLSASTENVRVQVVIDGVPHAVLALRSGQELYDLTAGLATGEGEHTGEVVKRTEPLFGDLRFHGLALDDGGVLLPPPDAADRRLEFIGDSITCGYGNEAPGPDAPFLPDSQNAWLTYGTLAARALEADATLIAWSGATLRSAQPLPAIYGATLARTDGPQWDPGKAPVPDAFLINLGTNDLNGPLTDEEGWVLTCQAFLSRLREAAPQAWLYVCIGPMLRDGYPEGRDSRTVALRLLRRVVEDARSRNDPRVALLDFGEQRGEDGFGAGWHPSAATHRRMAEHVVRALRRDLGW